MHEPASPSAGPVAVIRRRSAWRHLAWLLPLAALALAIYAGWRTWGGRGGERIVVHFADGHGLRVGDTLRHRGIVAGQVRDVALENDLGGVRVDIRLAPEARGLAREGSLFWIVRPKIGWGGIAGLDTLAGARYLDVLPGGGAAAREFTGLEDTPVAALCPPGGLEVVVQAATRGGVRPGSPVTYRQLAVGRVVSTGLSSDGGAVDIRIYIDPPYTALVRQRTIFWQDSGMTFHLGFKEGVRVGFDSPETLLSGGVAFATPPQGGEPVTTGHRFALQEQPKEDWLGWQPAVAVGPTVDGEQLPRPLATTLGFTRKELFIDRQRSHRGWTLAIPGGLLGPATLLTPDKTAKENTLALEVAGARYPLAGPPVWQGHGLAALRIELPADSGAQPWSRARMRAPTGPEDCLLIGDPALDPTAIAAARLSAHDGAWDIDHAIAIDPSWHGAAVIARRDGSLIGFLVAEVPPARIAPLPEPLPDATSPPPP
jgi:hypothetical protein